MVQVAAHSIRAVAPSSLKTGTVIQQAAQRALKDQGSDEFGLKARAGEVLAVKAVRDRHIGRTAGSLSELKSQGALNRKIKSGELGSHIKQATSQVSRAKVVGTAKGVGSVVANKVLNESEELSAIYNVGAKSLQAMKVVNRVRRGAQSVKGAAVVIKGAATSGGAIAGVASAPVALIILGVCAVALFFVLIFGVLAGAGAQSMQAVAEWEEEIPLPSYVMDSDVEACLLLQNKLPASECVALVIAGGGASDLSYLSLGERLAVLQSYLAELSFSERESALQTTVDRYNLVRFNGLTVEEYRSDRSASAVRLLAVKYAKSQLGKPYVWGATGPNSFDCSGLMQWIFAQSGIDMQIPRVTEAQMAAAPKKFSLPADLNKLRPGDLLWHFGHIGIYIGGGEYIHAPQTGDVVRVAKMTGPQNGLYGWQRFDSSEMVLRYLH